MRVVEGAGHGGSDVGRALLPHMGLSAWAPSPPPSPPRSLTGHRRRPWYSAVAPLPEVRYGIGYSTAESLTVRLGKAPPCRWPLHGTGNVVDESSPSVGRPSADGMMGGCSPPQPASASPADSPGA